MHELVTGNDGEYEPFTLINESGFGREKTISNEVIPPPDAQDQIPPAFAQKSLIDIPFPSAYVCTIVSDTFSYELFPGLQSGASHDEEGNVSAKNINEFGFPLWKCRPYPALTVLPMARPLMPYVWAERRVSAISYAVLASISVLLKELWLVITTVVMTAIIVKTTISSTRVNPALKGFSSWIKPRLWRMDSIV